jgi:hypothetical protein
MAVIDADIIVTRWMPELVKKAAAGHLVAFEDYNEQSRFFPAWDALGLGIPTKQPYVNAGNLILSAATAETLFPLLIRLHDRIVIDETMWAEFGTPSSSPFYYAEQDLLNAILCTCFKGQITRVSRRLAPMPPFAGLTVKDAGRLICEYSDGIRPFQLHHAARVKPWAVPMSPSAYSILFTRLVTGPDVRVRTSDHDIPLRLREGLGLPARAWVSTERIIHSHLRGKLGLRPMISKLAHRARAGRVY